MENSTQEVARNNAVPAAILIAGVLIAGAVLFKDGGAPTVAGASPEKIRSTPAALIRQANGQATTAGRSTAFTLPFRVGDLGQRLASVGVIDREQFLALYDGAMREFAQRLLDEKIDEPLVVTEENAGVVLNLLWALGLGQESRVLSQGPMTDPRYDVANLASTAGWTVSDGDPMTHYGRHRFFQLSAEELTLVERVAKGIYRPCCDNATHFPDCNHGMAMLGLLELMASQGADEEELYRAALAMNRLWFPAQYEKIDRYARERGSTEPRAILGAAFSSASGFQKIARELESASQLRRLPAPAGGGEGGGCSV